MPQEDTSILLTPQTIQDLSLSMLLVSMTQMTWPSLPYVFGTEPVSQAESNFQCEHCRRNFKTEKTLKRHLETGIHTKSKFICNISEKGKKCGKDFKYLGNLSLHQLQHKSSASQAQGQVLLSHEDHKIAEVIPTTKKSVLHIGDRISDQDYKLVADVRNYLGVTKIEEAGCEELEEILLEYDQKFTSTQFLKAFLISLHPRWESKKLLTLFHISYMGNGHQGITLEKVQIFFEWIRRPSERPEVAKEHNDLLKEAFTVPHPKKRISIREKITKVKRWSAKNQYIKQQIDDIFGYPAKKIDNFLKLPNTVTKKTPKVRGAKRKNISTEETSILNSVGPLLTSDTEALPKNSNLEDSISSSSPAFFTKTTTVENSLEDFLLEPLSLLPNPPSPSLLSSSSAYSQNSACSLFGPLRKKIKENNPNPSSNLFLRCDS